MSVLVCYCLQQIAVAQNDYYVCTLTKANTRVATGLQANSNRLSPLAKVCILKYLCMYICVCLHGELHAKLINLRQCGQH